ncbi:DUF7564 family protein [Salinigranum sp. GCM10025319]|uniref:DUF7564 family protein n=1 Tax=Salinigranum sp. GCM10025319 TaxID=3252687 RepID=UPI00361292F7
MVARHNRGPRRHTAGDGVCIDCGTRYLLTNVYKGNYCQECHEAWISRQRGKSSAPRTPPRVGPSDLPTDTVEEGEEPYDEE